LRGLMWLVALAGALWLVSLLGRRRHVRKVRRLI